MTEAPNAPTVQSTPQEPAAQDPQANTLAVVGFVLAFVVPPIGIVVSAIAMSKAGKIGLDSKLAKWGLSLAIVFTVAYLVLVGLGVYAALSLAPAAAM